MLSQETGRANASRGFTLIELLVVIAVIAILAALLFPVFGLVQENVRKTTCMTRMHSVQVALAQYRLDNNKYPDVLYGLAELPGGGYYVGTGAPAPFTYATQRPLFKATGGKYMKDPLLFTCEDNASVSPTDVTEAVYPTAPGVTLTGVVPHPYVAGMPAYYYKQDSGDVGPQIDSLGNVVKNGGVPVMELRYSPNWTNTVGPGDSPNQLKYPDPPPDKTVVTWDTYHVATAHSNVILVLMLSGTVKPVPINQFVPKGPLNFTF